MKTSILLVLLLTAAFNLNAQDFLCKNDLSKDYEFEYNIKDNFLNYKIKSKNNKNIKYIYLEKYGLSNIIGFNILNSVNKNPLNDEINSDIITNKYLIFYQEKENFYSINLMRGTLNNLIIQSENKNYVSYIESEHINKNVDINKLINILQPLIPEDNRYKEQKIKIKIKLALDPDLNNCAVFETKYFNYDLGSKFYYNIKSFFNIFGNE